MTLWTIQSLERYQKLLKEKEIRGEGKYIDEDFKNGYDWMVKQMQKRIGENYKLGSYPIWAWYQYHSKQRKKPDLRRSGHLGKGQKGGRLTIEKKEQDVLLSDFILWHNPLTYRSKISNTEKEDEEFQKRLKNLELSNIDFYNYPIEIKEEIINSWDKIFDLNFDCSFWTYPKDFKIIQATFWKLELKEVINVDYFTAR